VSDIDQNAGTGTEIDRVARLEVELLDPAVRADAKRLDELLHPDFVEHGASGRTWTRQSIIDELPLEDGTTPRTTASDIEAQHLTDDVILVTYRTTSTLNTAVRSSLWLRSATGLWHIRFHQGTPLPNGVPTH
jgi:ribonuclease HI